jgi:polyhydroxyalkanoate synthase
MTDKPGPKDSSEGQDAPGIFSGMLHTQAQAVQAMLGKLIPAMPDSQGEPADTAQWTEAARRLQALWLEFQTEQVRQAAATLESPPAQARPEQLMATLAQWSRQVPLAQPETQKRLLEQGLSLWQSVLGQYGVGPKSGDAAPGDPVLPRSDRRFADPKWRENPFFALLHQTYLMLSEEAVAMAGSVEGLEPARKQALTFSTRALADALSPANFALTNPVALEKARETRGQSLVAGLEHMIADMRKGQLTHTDPAAFELGRNIAVTPGKVVHETALYQIIQYTPVTETVLRTPLVIFPPWINRFYILDLNPQKSFVRWAVEQGISVFMVSWKSADSSMAGLTWDDYILAQMECIDLVRARLGVPSVHTIGYCVAGTTLAATLAVQARRGEGDKVRSATFFTAQVDFEDAGDLKHFVDDQQIGLARQMAPEGFLDGRLMAATFNLLRGQDLIWNYVVNNYLLGEDYPAFDLLHWNGDVTNLPVAWHGKYLRELCRDNLLVVPDRLSADGTPIDLRRIAVPCYIQAGREDHIAPVHSVWKLTRYLSGPWTFLLAGSGHIAGVVNPPPSKKYGYWTNSEATTSLEEFIAGAQQHEGSWWPHWAEWMRALDGAVVKATGKRRPGSRGDRVIEDAPGRYVMMR